MVLEEKARAGSEQLSNAQLLVKLANENAVLFFNDQYGRPHALVQVGSGLVEGHKEVIPVKSGKFELYLRKLFYESQNGMIPSQEAINSAIKQIAAITEFDRQSEELHLRVAWGIKNEQIIYDLTNDTHDYVRIIRADGWDIIKNPDRLFIRFNQKPQVIPSKNYPADIFDKYLDLNHITDYEHRLLTKVWTIACFVPDIPHTIDDTHGEKGAAKTTFCRMQKRLIDPDALELLTIPKDRNEFIQQLHHNYLAVYDNIKHVPFWFSDEVCRAITGAGNSKRALYTDDDDVIYNYRRCVMVNGINNILTEPDALDRCLLTELVRIPTKHRRTEAAVFEEFEAMRPMLLGYIFDILSKALAIKPTVKLAELPRMADFAEWGEAIARAMGYEPGRFMQAYYNNIGKQNVEAIESNPLAQAIVKFAEQNSTWEGTVSDFKDRLDGVAEMYKINSDSPMWPKAANSLSRKLKPILSNLREGQGIEVRIEPITQGEQKGSKAVKVEKISPLSLLSQPAPNHAQNEPKMGGDISSGGDNTSTNISTVAPQNEAQIDKRRPSSGSGDSGDIFGSSEYGHLCPYCDHRANTLEQLERHAIKVHPGRPFTADYEEKVR